MALKWETEFLDRISRANNKTSERLLSLESGLDLDLFTVMCERNVSPADVIL
jgi:hypothetical protein